MDKAAARALARARRAGCAGAVSLAAADLVPAGAKVAGYYPLAGEIDVLPLLHMLADKGHVILLPETPPKGEPLVFRRWDFGVLLSGRFGTMVPDGEVLRPDFVLVPLLGFDAAGNRLGYGGGYYDRTLAALPQAFRLGCGFAVQQMDEIPVEAWDVRLQGVVTENGVLLFG